MYGLMMDNPLTITSIMQHADANHPNAEIVSVTAAERWHRYRYQDAFKRTRQLANALMHYGIQPGDRLCTLAWNDYRHIELYYAISCLGAIIHTVNPRLFPEQISYIINHAEDRLVFVDPLIVPVIAPLQQQLDSVEMYIILTDDAHLPETTLANTCSYEAFIHDQAVEFDWPALDERAASSLCYTSGTTGDPKGVLYHHRSTVLHSLASASADVFGLSASDVVMPVVPMFHVNAWGLSYSAPMCGAKLVMPGPKMGDGQTLCRLIQEEGVSLCAGVPTIWAGLLRYLANNNEQVPSLKKVMVGGSACPLSMMHEFEQRYGVVVAHAWGMTEMSPLGTTNTLKPSMRRLAQAEQDAIRIKQGRAMYGVSMKIVDEDDNTLPRDGRSTGLLKVRGPTVCCGYYKQEASEAHDAAGWFCTGDVGHIDAEGYLQLTDRAKDVIKSGGEWISSIALENAAVAHPDVLEAAVIGVHHPQWGERPLLIVVAEAALTQADLLDFLTDKVAKWWLPDAVIFVDRIPHTATGKIQKSQLREQFEGYVLPDCSS